MGEWLVTNVARVALSCTCLPRIIHKGLLEKDINRELVSFRSRCKFSFEMDSKFEVLALTLTRSSPWVRVVQNELRRERRGPRPEPREGKPVLTTAPWSSDHGDGNTGRLQLWSAVKGAPREAWEWRTSRYPLPLYLRVRTDWSAKLTRGLGKRPNRITPATAQANTKDKAGEVTRRGGAAEEGFGSRIYMTITTRM